MNALTAAQPQELSPKKRPLRIAPKLREAIEAAITEGLRWPDAARKVGLTARAMRMALNKPHILRHISERKAQFRAEIGTRNEFRLAELRDQDDNRMAAVNSIKLLEQLDRERDERPALHRHVTPGVVVVINADRGPRPQGLDQIIEINPVEVGADG